MSDHPFEQQLAADLADPKARERQAEFTTVSGLPIKRLYTHGDLAGFDPITELGLPGRFPFTRGVQKTMYRGRVWTMRQFAGFGTAEESNERYKYLLANGQTGLSVAFHLPTIMGHDSDHSLSRGEVGKVGVAIDSLADMERLFAGIPLDQVSTSMTINAPAAILLAMYYVVAEKQGIDPATITGTIQNDILKEYQAQKSWIFPPRPSLRIIADIFAWCARAAPRFNTISISGYHIREAGATALQELAFTLINGIEYVKTGLSKGLAIDEFAPRLSFFFNSHNDFLEEVAKFRAARRIWARVIRDRFGSRDPRSQMLRFHTQTAGCSLTAQQPENNIVRVAIQALAAVMGGTQSLHTNSMDEALALPTEKAVRIALRTQQVIAEESGVANTIDPLAGSYAVEALTNEMERGFAEYERRVEELGGVVPAIEAGFFQREIAEAAFRFQREVERGERKIVGVNAYQTEDPGTGAVEVLRIGPELEAKQIERVRAIRQERDRAAVEAALAALRTAAAGTDNLLPPILAAVRAYATIGEMCDALRAVFGEYEEPPIY